ncbi:glycerophosphodiester phosphodiesterase family protein [Promicromonospora thailandica]|uniref:Glycerophosphoryl diester phosphodiesterase n=1 Tax=Promicromonospora thailandica TaxID=765201 RepID=A0A9X2K0X5_9MICO|nr:glycerophosphodiester phosphodiesterase family protein [Promicromonospora thailandica]MCP2267484.1 glycerophosphoryl diester phosphodiesterase [Promicromonospora thailandica]
MSSSRDPHDVPLDIRPARPARARAVRPRPVRPRPVRTLVGAAVAAAALVLSGAAVVAVDRPGPAQTADAPAGGHAARTPAERAYRDLLDHGPDAKVLTAAHRAQWRSAPENSAPAILAAFADGAEIVELDVQLTADGVPVLMHDTTVDRTTDGTGRVDDLTLEQVRRLRLRAGLGGAQAPLTDERVPTLAEAMRLAKDRGLVNLDKGWPFREEIWTVLQETGTVRNGLFKSGAPVPEVQEFRSTHRGAVYMHIVTDTNVADVDAFGADQPVAYEVNFDSTADVVARRPFLDRVASGSRVWSNTMWDGLAERMTDEASLIDPGRGWAALLRSYRTTIVQTDDVEAFERWLRTGAGDPVPHGGVRVQAEDFLPGEGVGYHDLDPANRSNLQMRPGEGVDIQDLDGAVSLGWMRGGEWLTYHVQIPRTGTYEVAVRASSPYSPAGAYTVSFDDGAPSAPVDVRTTTSHAKQELQPSGVTRRLTKGPHTLRIGLPADAYQNWNLDYVQLTP